MIYEHTESKTSESKFLQLKMHILDILVNSLAMETNQGNVRFCLNLLQCCVMEDAHLCPGLPNLVIKAIQELIVKPGHWKLNIILFAIENLNQYTIFSDYIQRDNKSCPRELVLTLCRYIENQFPEDSFVNTQTAIVKAIECITRWSLVGQWIATDKDCLRSVLSILCQAITMLEKNDNDFAAITGYQTENSQTLPTLLSSTTPGVSEKEIVKPPPLAQKKSKNMSTKIFEKIQRGGHAALGSSLNATPSAQGNTSSSEARDQRPESNVGVPTFAKLSAGIVIQAASEIALMQITNFLGNYPPYGERIGVSSISSLWTEQAAVHELIYKKTQNMRNAGKVAPLPDLRLAADVGKYVRYYSLDKRVIVAFVELPQWDNPKLKNESGKSVPSVVMVLRDVTGKFTWMSSLKYVDEKQEREAKLGSQDSLAADSSLAESMKSSRSTPATSPTKAKLNKMQDELARAMSGMDFDDDMADVHPDCLPYSPLNCSVQKQSAIDEAGVLPSTWKMFPSSILNTESAIGILRTQLDMEEKIEKSVIEKERSKAVSDNVKEMSPPALDFSNENARTEVYRLFLAHYGFLSFNGRDKLVPLKITENLLRELRKFDALQEYTFLA
jgi:hypothetical protein